MRGPVTYEEAVVLVTEIGESLGGRQQEALRVLLRYAERGRRRSSSAAIATHHFQNATDIIKKTEDDT